jgi:hypothetical protein
LITATLEDKGRDIQIYIDASSTGIYIIKTLDDREVLAVNKTNIGWSVLRKGIAAPEPALYVMPLILLLENKFYN